MLDTDFMGLLKSLISSALEGWGGLALVLALWFYFGFKYLCIARLHDDLKDVFDHRLGFLANVIFILFGPISKISIYIVFTLNLIVNKDWHSLKGIAMANIKRLSRLITSIWQWKKILSIALFCLFSGIFTLINVSQYLYDYLSNHGYYTASLAVLPIAITITPLVFFLITIDIAKTTRLLMSKNRYSQRIKRSQQYDHIGRK